MALVKEVKEMKEIFEHIKVEVEQNAVDTQCANIERQNLLFENENLIADCLSNELLYSVMNDVNTVSRFSEMHDAYTVEQARCIELEAEISKLKHKIQKDDHIFEINKMKESLQGKDNTIRKLKGKISQMNERRSEADRILDFKALDFQNTELTEKVTALQEQNTLFREENEKVKKHYKEFYDSIKITRAKTIEKTTSLLTENEKLKAQIKGKMQCVTIPAVKPKVLAPVMYAIDVEPIPPRNRNNRECVVKYLKSVRAPSAKNVVSKVKQVYSIKVVPLKQHENVSTSETVITERLSNTSQTPLTRYKRRNKQDKAISTSIPIIAETQTIDASVKYTAVVQIVLWYLDSGYSKHMTGNRSRLKNFVKKFIETVRFKNDHFGAIMGYGDYVIGDSVISRVYYVKGLRHNLFFVGQFCDSDLEVAFRKHSCYVRNEDGMDLLKGSCGSNLYTISVEDMMKSSPICLLSKSSKNKSWLWHRQLNQLNFGTINDLARKDLVTGLPRLKFEKDHLFSACQLGKNKKYTHKPKSENIIMEVLHTLYMDLCGPMRVQSINENKYILVIVDDYSRFTWVKFLRSKDETPEFVIKFLKQIQVGLNKTVRYIRTDNGTLFVNQVLTELYESVGIFYQKSVSRTPQQNDIVERQNCTLVEAARTMLIFFKALMFLWAEVVAIACYTKNRSLIHTRHKKTPYELVHDKNPDLKFL
ncbi:retrovirus-related pol polyprotein from transposon TNT 1-94 [Tanacetum coccineum]|uniref:Retrovirus-related pol polyprotein from transposon TNT 1-94 n=1 Tax=Tanacetum coccineum TaxID=301880 RepID=A0ABQ4ZC22_9ASTR